VQQASLSYVGTFEPEAERKQEGDFATGVYVGGGFQLIRRNALQKMIAAYPETHFNSVHSLPMSGARRIPCGVRICSPSSIASSTPKLESTSAKIIPFVSAGGKSAGRFGSMARAN